MTASYFAQSLPYLLMVLALQAAGLAVPDAPALPRPHCVVAADGSGQYKTVGEAIASAASGTHERFVIRIAPGTYHEKLDVPRNKCPITLYGDDESSTVISYDDYAGRTGADGKPLGTGGSYSVQVESDDFRAEHLTIENSHGMGGGTGNQALALSVRGDRVVFRQCRILGRQDTIYLERNRQYFEDCSIAGQVDYIFGGATAWFERCNLTCVAPGVSITAASTPQDKPYGFVFSHCSILAGGDGTWQTHLGRPWRPYASVTYLNTRMAPLIAPTGWDNWGNAENEKTARYAEFNSCDSQGVPLNTADRLPWAHVLTADEAATYRQDTVLGGWNPNS